MNWRLVVSWWACLLRYNGDLDLLLFFGHFTRRLTSFNISESSRQSSRIFFLLYCFGKEYVFALHFVSKSCLNLLLLLLICANNIVFKLLIAIRAYFDDITWLAKKALTETLRDLSLSASFEGRVICICKINWLHWWMQTIYISLESCFSRLWSQATSTEWSFCARGVEAFRRSSTPKGLHRHVFILRKCKIIGIYSIIVASNYVLTWCFAVGSIEKRRIILEHFAVSFNGCLVVLLFFC